MTVRWKPLLILSGLFLVIAVVSVIAFAYTLVPRGSADILHENGEFLKNQQVARMYQTQADSARVDYRRKLIDFSRIPKRGRAPDLVHMLVVQQREKPSPEVGTGLKEVLLRKGAHEALLH